MQESKLNLFLGALKKALKKHRRELDSGREIMCEGIGKPMAYSDWYSRNSGRDSNAGANRFLTVNPLSGGLLQGFKLGFFAALRMTG